MRHAERDYWEDMARKFGQYAIDDVRNGKAGAARSAAFFACRYFRWSRTTATPRR